MHEFHPSILGDNCIDENVQCFVNPFVLISPRTCQMRDLDHNVPSFRQHVFKEYPGLFSSPWATVVDVRANMNNDRHAVTVGGSKDTLHLRNMAGLVQLHVRIAEMEL